MICILGLAIIRTIVTIFFLWCAFGTTLIKATPDIHRLNMGTIFRFHGEISIVTGHYKMLVTQKLPSLNMSQTHHIRCAPGQNIPLEELQELLERDSNDTICAGGRHRSQ